MKTINLKDYRSHHNAPLYIFLGIIGLLFIVNALGSAPAQPQVQATPGLAYVMVIATAQPTMPPPTPDMQLQQEIEALRARVAELEAAQIERRISTNVEIGAIPEPQAVILVQAAPTMAPPTPAPTEAPRLQTFAVPEDGEGMSPALLREAMDR